HPARAAGRASCARAAQGQPRGSARCPSSHSRARGSGRARPLRLDRVEGLPRRRPLVSLVLDSSATLAWIFGDETTEAIRELFDQVAESGAVVPALWRLEVANSLT